MPLADISFGEGLLFIFEFFLLFAWIWILISIIAGSPAGELHKLAELKEKGALSSEEFDQAKAKLPA